jgi:hypothetical protein
MTLDQEAAIYGMFRKSGESDPDFECRIESACANVPHQLNAIQGMLLTSVLSLPIWILIVTVVYYGIF